MSLEWEQAVVDARDPVALGHWWHAEVECLIALGASRIDVGQGEASWVVLADPEGNEFCVLRSRRVSP